MKLTQEIIDQIQEAMLHTKKDGSINWKDDDEIVVQLAGTFAADRFIVIKNKTKDPVVSAAPHPDFDYERKVFTKDGREEYMKEYATQRLHNDIKKAKSKNLIMTSITKTLILQLKKIANFIALEGENKECYWYGLTLTIYALIGDL